MQDLCADLKLEVDDDVAELDVDVSRYQEEDDGEVNIPLCSCVEHTHVTSLAGRYRVS